MSSLHCIYPYCFLSIPICLPVKYFDHTCWCWFSLKMFARKAALFLVKITLLSAFKTCLEKINISRHVKKYFFSEKISIYSNDILLEDFLAQARVSCKKRKIVLQKYSHFVCLQKMPNFSLFSWNFAESCSKIYHFFCFFSWNLSFAANLSADRKQ